MLWSERIQRGRRKTTNAIALATAFLAFSVRFYWSMRVQSPFTALYSDMNGYYSRGIDFLEGKTHGDPRNYAFFPWGAHVLVGLELGAVGRTSHLGIAIIHSIVSTLPAICVVYFTDRVVKSRFWVVAAGVAAAFWQPSVVYTGFFMSEMWFSAGLVVGTLYFLRHLEGKSGAFRAGCALAVAIVVRPQVLLTFGLVGAVLVAVAIARRTYSSLRSPISVRNWIRFCIPLVLMLSFSALRFHRYTGHWGLVSENGPINRVFGATHLGRVEAYWNYKGGRYGAWYTPPAKTPVKPEDMVVFEGYIGDADILERIKEEHMKRETRTQYVLRMHRNVKMLVYRFIFPEDNYVADDPRRAWLQRTFRVILVNLLPIGLFGIFAMLMTRGRRLVGFLIAANGLTVIVVAALYFAEARMRMPYDPFLLTAAAAGAATIGHMVVRLWRLLQERRQPMT